jgi:uncharacterized protein (DUF2235 family)
VEAIRLARTFRRWLGLGPRVETTPQPTPRGRIDHVVLLDGTMSTLRPGHETNIGLIYKLLCEVAPTARLSLRYEAGVQWESWGDTLNVIEGRGINRQIQRAYGFIASRYRPGDRIFLFGYSRGAYAARSLAGVIDTVGLLRAKHATERNVRLAYRYYRVWDAGRDPAEAPARGLAAFRRLYCHERVPIEMVGVFDTVKALGFRAPFLWRLTEGRHLFHNHALGPSIRHGYHALALDETREAFAPVLWESWAGWPGEEVVQMWFRGAHGDIGGQLGGFHAARPLSNIPLVWMLEKAAGCDLPLPRGWRARFPTDPDAPAVGVNRGWGRLFLARRRRVVGRDPSEQIHPSARGRKVAAVILNQPWLEMAEPAASG